MLFRPSLYDDPRFEHDACGVGFGAPLRGQPGNAIVANALEGVANLSHPGRAGRRAEEVVDRAGGPARAMAR